MSLRPSMGNNQSENSSPSAETKSGGDCKVEEGLKSEQENTPQPSQYLKGWRLYWTVTG